MYTIDRKPEKDGLKIEIAEANPCSLAAIVENDREL
jgi:hypothetical protein